MELLQGPYGRSRGVGDVRQYYCRVPMATAGVQEVFGSTTAGSLRPQQGYRRCKAVLLQGSYGHSRGVGGGRQYYCRVPTATAGV